MTGTRSTTWLYAFGGFALYFGLFFTPKVVPAFSATPFSFLLTLSLMLVVPLLVILALWAVSALVIAKSRKRSIGRWSRTAGQTAVAGLSTFVAFMALATALPSQLPSGSYDSQFDRAVWVDPESTIFISGDITPRQKMLSDVVKRLPGKNRVELENMLGTSLDTPYFQSTGRDLIYVTGPERDSLFSIDSEWLLIWVDENGIYKRHAVVTD